MSLLAKPCSFCDRPVAKGGYGIIYSMYLKRATPQSIVIGGVFGAAPPLFGWTAVTNQIDLGGILLLLIIFTWTPPRAAAAVALAPEGAMPGAVMASTVEVVATVVAIDSHEHTVTLEFRDGRIQEVHVGKHRDLSNVGLGDSVRVQITEAVAISVVRP